MEVFPKRKELASLKQLFVLHGNEGNFLYASPLNAGPYELGEEDKHRFARWRLICSRVYVTKDKRKNTHLNEQSDVASKVRPHFLSVKWKERYGALKRKSCLSEASSFPLAEYPTGIAQKVQTAVFLFCYLFSFCCQKEKSKKRQKEKSKSKQSQKRYYLCTNKRRKHVSRSNQ